MYNTQFALAMVLVTTAFVSAADDDAKKDLKKLEGKWQLTAQTANGKEASADDVKKVTVTIDADGKWKAFADGQLIFEGTVKLDPAKKPKNADWTVKVEDKTVTAQAIYEVDDDTLKNCFSTEKRPEKFESKEGSGITLAVYKRVK
jgi:uncharacterized protein (TIGR03067 family)